jgi:hypothetical protein
MTECFWCENLYEPTEYDRCPKCVSDLHTKEIKIIEVKDED